MSNTEKEQEPREAPRIRTLRAGRVYSHGGKVSVDCIIRDLTNQGARIQFVHPFQGPDRISLQVGIGDRAIAPFDCDVRWSRGTQVGVLFLDPHDIKPDYNAPGRPTYKEPKGRPVISKLIYATARQTDKSMAKAHVKRRKKRFEAEFQAICESRYGKKDVFGKR